MDGKQIQLHQNNSSSNKNNNKNDDINNIHTINRNTKTKLKTISAVTYPEQCDVEVGLILHGQPQVQVRREWRKLMKWNGLLASRENTRSVENK
jgi:hypothetical protein